LQAGNRNRAPAEEKAAVRCSDGFLLLKYPVTCDAKPSDRLATRTQFNQIHGPRNTEPCFCILKEAVSIWPAICIDFNMLAKCPPLFLMLLLLGSTGCVTQQRYADVLREVEQKEKQQRKLESQLQALRVQNERMRDSLAMYPD
jgi:hypothetical protein